MLATAGLWCAGDAAAQTVLDRVDPTRVEESAPTDTKVLSDASVTAPRAVAAPPPAVASVAVGAIVVSGLTLLRPADFADVVERYVGRTLSPAELSELTDAIATRARARGLVLASASIPPQPVVAGVLRVIVDEGRVDEIRIEGRDNRAVRASLAPLIGTGPVTLARLEKHLLIAGDVDGIWLRGTRLIREGNRNILQVRLGLDRVSATASLDNSGSRPIGPIQADIVARFAHIFSDDDILALSAVVTPTQPDEFGFARLRYTKRISTAGTEMSASVSAARTHPGAYLRSRDIQGRSWTATLNLLHPLLRKRTASLWLEGSFGVRQTRQERADVLARRDRLTVARIGAYGYADVPGGRLRSSVTFSQGLDLFDATERRDPLSSRRDADGTFSSLTMTAEWTGPIVPDVTAQLAVATQIAAQPLLISEEVGIGGGQFLRAYDYSERSGDQGTMGSAEIRWALAPKLAMIRKPVLYAFVDGGRVTNLDNGSGGGTLFSTGAGIRMDVADLLTADIGVAVPLSGERYDSDNKNPVINFRLTHRF